MKKFYLILVLVFMSGTIYAFNLPQITTPSTSSHAGPTSRPLTQTVTSNVGNKRQALTAELNSYQSKPGDEALAHFRGKYGQEIEHNLGSYYWDTPGDSAGQCIKFSILINGPNVSNSSLLSHPCGQ